MGIVKSDTGRVYALFAIVVLACALGSLTQTVMNAMLGGIEADFGVAASTGQWLTTIYMLVLGVTVPLVTFLSIKLSMRSLLLITLTVFFAGSFVAFLAPSFEVLVAARVLQAFAAGITLPLVQSIAMLRFPRGQNGTAMGIAGIAMGFAPNIGPTIGGALVDSWGWRSFFVLLMGVLAVLFALSLLLVERESRSDRPAVLDVLSFVLSTCGFGGLLLGFSNASSVGFADPIVWAALAVGVICLVLFVWRQKRIEHPLISMDIFASCRYRASFVAQNLLFASFMGITLIVPLYVQGLCGGHGARGGRGVHPRHHPGDRVQPACRHPGRSHWAAPRDGGGGRAAVGRRRVDGVCRRGHAAVARDAHADDSRHRRELAYRSAQLVGPL